MKKILLASAFALFGTFAMANEVENDKYEVKYEISFYGCTAWVYYNGQLVKTFTEYSLISDDKACADAKAKADQFVRDNGGQP